MKKILVLSTGDVNGAYEAAYRICRIAIENGYQVAMVVQHRTRPDSFIRQAPPAFEHKPPTYSQRVINLLLRVARKVKVLPAPQSAPPRPKTDPEYLFLDEDEGAQYISGEKLLATAGFKPDLVIVGMTNGFINTNTLSELYTLTGANIYVWTVDMIPFTGGCHYSWGCKGYESDCANCPAIPDAKEKDWAAKNLAIKKKNVAGAQIKVLSGSGWTVMQARASVLFRNQGDFPNTNSCIDTRIFNSKHRGYAKNIFNLPPDSKLIFSGSQNIRDRRKGMVYFIEALNLLWESASPAVKENTYVLVAGRDSNEESEFSRQIPFKKHFVEYMTDYRMLSLAYQASDVFVCASIEDAGPMMVSEALACGTPVVGFENGLLVNMVENGYNGFKTEVKDSKGLAAGIDLFISMGKEEFSKYSANAVKQVEEHSAYKTAIEILRQIA